MPSKWKESKRKTRSPRAAHGDAYEGPVSGKPAPANRPAIGRILSTVKKTTISWLWKGYLPLGKLSIIDGDPGFGKSMLTCAIAANVTQGAQFIDNWSTPQAGVIIVNAEDTAEDTVVSRLENHGADMDRVLHIESVPCKTNGERNMTFPSDVPLLEAAIHAMEASFVVIDPITNHLDEWVKTRGDMEVRQALVPLKRLAERTNTAILMVRHLNKTEGGSNLYRGAGTMAFIALARLALIVGEDPDNEAACVLAVNKCNICKKAPSLRYQIFSKEDETGFVNFIGTSNHSARAVLAGSQGDEDPRTALADAMEVLRAILKEKALPVKQVEEEAAKARISGATLRRAKEMLGVVSSKEGVAEKGFWKWDLPIHEREKLAQKP